MGRPVKQRYTLSTMCGRSTYKLTWEEIVQLYRLTFVLWDGHHDLVSMRWGLAPSWWSKPLKELKLATFNARAETVTTKPFFRGPFQRTRCLIPVSGYYQWQDTPNGKLPAVSRIARADTYPSRPVRI